MAQFIIGVLVGGTIGCFATALCVAAKWGEENAD